MKSLEKLIGVFRKFPGVGPKQAERFAMHVIRAGKAEMETLCEAVNEAKSRIKYCSVCFDFSEGGICEICSDESRDPSLICVVEHPQDIKAIEKTKVFNGFYHVLHGSISPLSGADFPSLKIKELVSRVSFGNSGKVREIIIATNPDSDGDATAIYLTKILKDKVPKITRIAYGVPLGGDIDYLDELTLSYALRGRTRI